MDDNGHLFGKHLGWAGRVSWLVCVGWALASSGCTGATEAASISREIQGGEPVFLPGNPSCADLGHAMSVKIDPPVSGTFALGSALGQITVSIDGLTFDWSSTLGIDAVIVKGGPNAYAFHYDPEALAGSGLHAPVNPSSGQFFGLSHLEICFDLEVVVAKTAATSFDRTTTWSIAKTSEVGSLLISSGQAVFVPYEVTVAVAATADDNFAMNGAITIFNPAPDEATITAVEDTFEGMPLPVDCGVTFPHPLAPGATLACSYAAGLEGPSGGENRVAVRTSGPVGPGAATAAVDFALATITQIDDCVDVTDDLVGPMGAVCAGAAPASFRYELAAGPYAECGEHTVTNTATVVARDSGAEASDSVTVALSVTGCDADGCTLTPGYWKTHSSYGPAPYDDTWALLPSGADTPFFSSGASHHQVLWTPPSGGHAYYILAHAFIAAMLNELNGAPTAAIADALAAAAAIFEATSPAEIGALRKTNALRAELIRLAGELDAWNNGLTGPGHCDE